MFQGGSFLTQLLLPSHEIQVEELRGLFPLSASLPPPFLEYDRPLEKKYSILKESKESLDSDTACEDGVDDEDSNTTLQLGYYYYSLLGVTFLASYVHVLLAKYVICAVTPKSSHHFSKILGIHINFLYVQLILTVLCILCYLGFQLFVEREREQSRNLLQAIQRIKLAQSDYCLSGLIPPPL